MSLPLLDYDILLLILSTSDRNTLLACMRANRLLYAEGVKMLLRMPVILSWDGLKTVSFLATMKIRQQCHLLRALELTMKTLQPDTSALLAECLQNMTGLRSLLLRHPEELLRPDPVLLRSFSQLESLERINLETADRNAIELLRTTQSHLRSVTMHGGFGQHIRPCPLSILAHLSSSLEELVCQNWNHTQPPESEPYAVFLNLRTLTIEGVRSPSTARYAAATPSLAHLRIRSLNHLESTEVHVLNTIRHRNLQTSQPSWSTLEEFTGEIAEAYVLGLRGCRVRRLYIDQLYWEDIPLLRDVMADMRPVRLAVRAGFDDYTPNNITISTLFANIKDISEMADLRSLELIVIHIYSHILAKLDIAWLKKLFVTPLTAIRSRSVERLVCCFDVQQDTQDADHDSKVQFASYAFDLVPSLQVVELKSVSSLSDGHTVSTLEVVRGAIQEEMGRDVE